MTQPPAPGVGASYVGCVDGRTEEKRIRLRFVGTCRMCGSPLPAKADAIYERATRTVRCVSHEVSTSIARPAGEEPSVAVPEVVDPGTAGASARREFERRKAAREGRIRAKHPKLGGLILAVSEDPQSTTAWNTGALGEEKLGSGLNRLGSESIRLLHDRRMPRSRANIDHLAVTPTGVYVIDAKKYRGRPHLKIDGGLFQPRVERLLVGSRDCSKLVQGVLKQVEVVRDILTDGVPVHGVLCFVEADWPLLGGDFITRDVHALWPKKLYPKLQADGPLTSDAIAEIHRTLAGALPPS